MYINISYQSGEPIYEQIKTQIRAQILRGDLPEEGMLPSIRTLARELKIGIVTAKRAYDDLCTEGFLYTVQGKGVFVAPFDREKAECYALREIEEKLKDIVTYAGQNSVDNEKIKQLIKDFLENKL